MWSPRAAVSSDEALRRVDDEDHGQGGWTGQGQHARRGWEVWGGGRRRLGRRTGSGSAAHGRLASVRTARVVVGCWRAVTEGWLGGVPGDLRGEEGGGGGRGPLAWQRDEVGGGQVVLGEGRMQRAVRLLHGLPRAAAVWVCRVEEEGSPGGRPPSRGGTRGAWATTWRCPETTTHIPHTRGVVGCEREQEGWTGLRGAACRSVPRSVRTRAGGYQHVAACV